MPKLFAWSLTIVALAAATVTAQPTVEFVNNGREDVPLYLPSNYDPTQPLPLIVGLHGYTSRGPILESYFDFTTQIEAKQFMYLIPTGTRDGNGFNFWAATDACCGSGVDDSGYLRSLVDLVRTQYSVDDMSIHFAGHSNGGFMSHRMAIDHADMVASIASLAGANFSNAAAYNPSDSVHMLQVHGTADTIIRYNGGNILGVTYPGAVQTSNNWANYNGLTTTSIQTDNFDLDYAVTGDETTSFTYDLGSPLGTTVELWRMQGSNHSPTFGDGASNLFAPRVVDWLLSHRKAPTCDLIANDACDVGDIDALVAEIVAMTNNPAFDLNNDGLVDLVDRNLWLAAAGEHNLGPGRAYLPGDANLDTVVDGSDFILWNDNKFTNVAMWSAGDFDANGSVDGGDFILWNDNKFTSADTPVAVPEPTGMLMFGLLAVWHLSNRR